MSKGNKVTVDFNEKTVTVYDKDGATLQQYTPPTSGHSVSISFDPNDPQPVLGHNQVDGGRSAEALAKLAVQASAPSEGAVVELLGEDAPSAFIPTGPDSSAFRETGREGGVNEREFINPNESSTSLSEAANTAQAQADDLAARAEAQKAVEADRGSTSKKTASASKE